MVGTAQARLAHPTNRRSRLDDGVFVLDMHRKGLGDIRPLDQIFAALDRDRMGADFDALSGAPSWLPLLRVSAPHTVKTVDPVVLRAARSAWALAASFSG